MFFEELYIFSLQLGVFALETLVFFEGFSEESLNLLGIIDVAICGCWFFLLYHVYYKRRESLLVILDFHLELESFQSLAIVFHHQTKAIFAMTILFSGLVLFTSALAFIKHLKFFFVILTPFA